MEVRKSDNSTIELHTSFSSNTSYEMLVEMSIPKSVDIPDEFSVRDFFRKSVSSKSRFHKGHDISLMLLYIKLLNKKGLDNDQFKISISLFIHLLLKEIQALSNNVMPEEEFSAKFESVNKLISDFRDFSFENEKKHLLFCKLDCLVSFEYEQRLLKLMLDKSYTQETKQIINDTLEAELKYRKENHYNFPATITDNDATANEKASKIISHFDIQKKLVEVPFRLNSKENNNETKEKYLSLGISTTIIMSVFVFIMFQLKLLGMDTNIQFFIAFAAIYAVRDIFKESIKTWVFSKITKNKPVNVSTITIPSTKEVVIEEKTWINLEESVAGNAKDASMIIIKKSINVNGVDFNGLSHVKETMTIDLTQILRMFPYGKKDYYHSNSQRNIQKLSTSRRGKLDIKIMLKEKSGKKTETNTRTFKVIFDRSKVVSVERAQ